MERCPTARSLDPVLENDSSVLGLVLRHSRSQPNELALKDANGSLTYRQLYERVVSVASAIHGLGVRQGERVALFLPDSIDFVLAALACLWLGAPFVPLSLDDPPARTARKLEDCEPALIIADRAHQKALPVDNPHPIVDPDILTGHVARDRPPLREPSGEAYVLYTFGTTGLPKGVTLPEAALRSSAAAMQSAVGFDSSTRSLSVFSLHFDGSYATLFPTLLAGGCVVIRSREHLLFLRRFIKGAIDDGATILNLSPSYLRLLLAHPHLSDLKQSQLTQLIVGGEECVAHDIERLWEIMPKLQVFNCYGPTETTIAVSAYEISREDVTTGRIPIGRPYPNVHFSLVDQRGELTGGPNETGELYI